MTADEKALPVLWQFRLSHFNEKARWVLDFKGAPHVRRSLVPGLHGPRIQRLTGQKQVPVLQLEGQTIVGSQAIIDAVERAYPEPPLYPADPGERQRALELCGVFNDDLGVPLRLAFFHTILPDSAYLNAFLTGGASTALRTIYRLGLPAIRRVLKSNLGVDDRRAAEARERSEVMLSRLEKLIRPSGYLVGDSFSVADLTAAALVSPLVQPPEFPYSFPAAPPALERLRESLGHRAVHEWCRGIYARHRGRSMEVK